MRADPELPAELPDQVRRVGVQGIRRLPERHRLAEAGVDQAAQLISYVGAGPCVTGHAAPAQVPAEPFGDERQPALRLEFLTRLVEYAVQLVDPLPQQRVGQHGLVDGLADEARGQAREIEVDDPLAEARGGGGAPVMRDVRRQQRDGLVHGAVLVAVQVVPDLPVVDDQQRPGLVRVHRVDMAGHARVEDLDDAGNRRPPGTDPRVADHAKIVQDPTLRDRVRSMAWIQTASQSGSTPRSRCCSVTTWKYGSG